MPVLLFNGLLTNTFQPTAAFLLTGETLVLHFGATVANIAVPGTPGRIEFYFEYTLADPNAVGTVFDREVSEEAIGNGDVRMSLVVRRFSPYGVDAPLPEGTYNVRLPFARKDGFGRLQVRVAAGGADNCSANISAIFGSSPLSAPP
jgi:hypothetical protein